MDAMSECSAVQQACAEKYDMGLRDFAHFLSFLHAGFLCCNCEARYFLLGLLCMNAMCV